MLQNNRKVLPIFLVGAAKSGTSSLFDSLVLDPKISGVAKKEPHFFSRNDKYEKGLDYYGSLFKMEEGTKFVLDASTSYLPSFQAHKRIFDTYGRDAKIILILRSPIERIQSHYNWLRSLNIEKRHFEEAIDQDLPFDEGVHNSGAYYNYLDFSRYGRCIQNLYKLFSEKNVLILNFEDLKSDNTGVYNRCMEFFGENEPSSENVKLSKSNQTRLIISHSSLMIWIYRLIPTSIKKMSLFRAVKTSYEKTKKNEDVYVLTDTDKIRLISRLKKDLLLQKSLFPSLFNTWKLNI
jgi:hypothetical protein